MMTIADRVTRYLLARLHRASIHRVYEDAAEAGLIETAFVDREEQAGLVWRPSPTMPIHFSGDEAADRDHIARLLRVPRSAPGDDGEIITLYQDEPPSVREGRQEQEEQARGQIAAEVGKDTKGRSSSIERDVMLRLLRSLAPRPAVAEAAVALLLARAIGESVADIRLLLRVLRQRDCMVLVKAPVDGFERQFGKMLEEGIILPSAIPQVDGLGNYALSGSYRDLPAKGTKMITFSGVAIRQKAPDVLRRFLAKARSQAGTPIVVADETDGDLDIRFTAAADLVVALGKVDQSLIAELLHVCAGIAPTASFAAMKRLGFDPAGVGLDDLVLAIRPGRDVDHIVSTLKVLSASGKQVIETEDADDDKKTTPGKGNRKKAAAAPAVKFDVTQPDVPEKGGEHQHALCVETLSGYGAAQTWSLDLKVDLALWREGQLDWADMSTRLLLSGPPGTGKTTFARALRNTLQVPMIATSVAHWLEPGYLGDVLKAMTSAFDAAAAHAPCILFLDEFDNIGSRGRAGQNADYWDSLINRMLEILDGATKRTGIIVVGATNHPESIDPALLRSGRLEKHVIIAPPDTDALVGILAHHLGRDLASVLASRPSGLVLPVASTWDKPVSVIETMPATRSVQGVRT
jgi:cell division protease FtsH